jgi:hypothetical protein
MKVDFSRMNEVINARETTHFYTGFEESPKSINSINGNKSYDDKRVEFSV